MGVFNTVGKVLIYPFTRPAKDISTSTQGIKSTLAAAKEFRDRKISDAKAANEYLAGMTGSEKFVEVFTLNRWTEKELAAQLTAARRTRLGMLGAGVFGLLFILAFMWSLPVWAVAILGPLMMVFIAACCAAAARYAWWEAQIRERSIFPLKEFMSRPDLFRRVLWV